MADFELTLYSLQAKQLWYGRKKSEKSGFIPGLPTAYTRLQKRLFELQKNEQSDVLNALQNRAKSLCSELKSDCEYLETHLKHDIPIQVNISNSPRDYEIFDVKFSQEIGTELALIIARFDQFVRHYELAESLQKLGGYDLKIRSGITREYQKKIRALLYEISK